MARKISALKNSLLAAVLSIPLTPNSGWKTIVFHSIPANRVEFAQDGLRVQVDRSAGALVRPLEKIEKVTAFEAGLQVSGEIPRSDAWPKDAYLRVGLIVPGRTKPGFWQRMMAPEWVRELMKLAPPGAGLDKVEIFELTPKTSALGQSREFPKSKGLMRETVAAIWPGSHDEFQFRYRLPRALAAAGVWLSLDGDDTRAKFSLRLKKLELTTGD